MTGVSSAWNSSVNRGLTAPRAASRIESGLDAVTSGLSCRAPEPFSHWSAQHGSLLASSSAPNRRAVSDRMAV
jgi:hypothetical protein